LIGHVANAQINYSQGWDAAGMGGWVSEDEYFSNTTAQPCSGNGAIRANLYYGLGDNIVSPDMGASNGGELTVNYSYKAVDYYDLAEPAFPSAITIEVQWASSASGPWTTLQTIDDSNYTESASCTPMSVSFFPPVTTSFYLRFAAVAQGFSDIYYYFDDVNITQGAPPTCFRPENVQATSLAIDSAEISWMAPSTIPASGYEYYLSEDSTAPTAMTMPTDVIASGTTLSLESLFSNTTYYLWLRSNCGSNDVSAWTPAFRFSTPCVPESLPYVMNFETATIPGLPNCTTSQNLGQANDWIVDIPDAYGFETQALIYVYDSDYDANTWFYTRGLNLTAGISYRVEYKYVSAGYTEKLKIAYGTQPDAGAMVNVLADYDNIDDEDVHEDFVDFTPQTTGVYYFGFNAYSDADQNVLIIDDIIIDVSPSCFKPLDVTLSGITATDVTVSWTAPDPAPAEGYEYYISMNDATPDEFITGVPVTSATSVTIDELFDNTAYYVWVRSNCGNGDYSVWTNTASFTTKCLAFPAPFSEALDAGTIPLCWVNTSSNPTGNGLWKFTGSVEYAPGNTRPDGTFAWVDGSTPTINDVSLVTPLIDLSTLTIPQLTFDFYSDNQGTYANNIFKVDVYDGTTWANVYTNNADGADWRTVKVVLGDYVGQTVQIRFVVDKTPAGDGNSYYNDILLDNISVDEAPTCVEPTNVMVQNIMPDSAQIVWNASASAPAEGYEVYYSQNNAAPDEFVVGNAVPTGTSYNMEMLSDNATYYVWVRSNCGNGDYSAWTEVRTFRTPCFAYTSPFLEEFSSAALPDCWSNTSSNPTGTGLWKFDGSVDYAEGNIRPNGTFAWVDGSDPSNISDVTLTSPLIDISTLTDPQLVFDMFSNNEGTYPNNIFNVEVYDGTTWSNVYTNNTSDDSWRTIEVSLAGYNGSVMIRFIVDKTAASTGNAFYNDILLDNVKVRNVPTCLTPSNLEMMLSSQEEGTLSWSASASAPAEGYEYYYSEDMTTPDAMATPSGTVGAGVTTADISGLTPDTAYYVWVRSVCSSSDSSEWFGPVDFFTGYCTPAPTSVDGDGIINVAMGSIDNATDAEDGNYADYSSLSTAAAAGSTVNFAITYNTGYTYGTKIWVDWNQNLVLEESEIVFDELSESDEPTVLSGSFMVPANTPAGDYRLRIGGTDNDDGPDSPCYSDTYGSFEDYTLSVFIAGTPVITSFTPDTYCAASGEITITGTELLNAELSIGGTEIEEIVSNTATEIVAVVPAGVSGTVTVTTTGGTVTTTETFTVTQPAEFTLSNIDVNVCNGSISDPIAIASGASDYDTFSWSPSLGVSGDDTIGWTFNPTTSTIYTLTATNSVSGCVVETEVQVTVNDLPGAVTITPNNPQVCAGEVQMLTATGASVSGDAAIGNGTEVPGTTSFPNPFSAYYGGLKTQMLYKADELTAQGMVSGSVISALSFDFDASVANTLNDMHIRIGQTTVEDMESSFVDNSTFTTVYNQSYTPDGTTGLVSFTLDTPFTWNGGNIIVEVIHNQGNSGNGSGTTTRATQTSYTSVRFAAIDGETPAGVATLDALDEAYLDDEGYLDYSDIRPNIVFSYDLVQEVVWSPMTNLYTDAAGTVPYNGEDMASVYVRPTSDGIYTATVTNSASCSIDAQVTLSVIDLGEVSGNANQVVTVSAAEDATLQDLVVTLDNGATVIWYASEADALGNTGALDPFTQLVNGTTYYALQTLNGCVSEVPFAVTVEVVLGNGEFDLASFSYYPNPVKNVLTLTYSSDITSVAVYNLLGQQVMNQKINAAEAKVDMSALADGPYVINVIAGDAVKSVKVIKKQ
jgi:hypothetical protein